MLQKEKGHTQLYKDEAYFMEEGDFLITPNGLWHGHGHTGEEPMIWMDCP